MAAELDEVSNVRPGQWCERAAASRAEGFSFLDFLTAVDWPDEGRIEVLVHLLSVVPGRALRSRRLHTSIPRADPVLDSLVAQFRGALWHERETHEMFGVTFRGHPDLRPLLLAAAQTPPLLRTTPLIARTAHAWPGLADPADHPPAGLQRAARPPARTNPRAPGVHEQWRP